MRRFTREQRLKAVAELLSKSLQRSSGKPHLISETTFPWLHLRISNGITHAGWYEPRSRDDNDARTLCGLALHYCDLQRCRHPDRHKGRTFSRLIPSERAETDCMACIASSVGLENP